MCALPVPVAEDVAVLLIDPAMAARVHRIALDLPDRQSLLVHVGQDAARRFAVEADARSDPVPPPFFFIEIDEGLAVSVQPTPLPLIGGPAAPESPPVQSTELL